MQHTQKLLEREGFSLGTHHWELRFFLPPELSVIVLQYSRSYVDRIARCLLYRYFLNDPQVIRYPVCYSCKTSFLDASVNEPYTYFAPQRELAMLQCKTCEWRRCAFGHVEKFHLHTARIIECSEMLENTASKPICIDMHKGTSVPIKDKTLIDEIESIVAHCTCFKNSIPEVPKILLDMFPGISRLPSC